MNAIYGLLDPRTQELRYVGQTRTSLTIRLSNHLSQARRSRKNWREKWIGALLDQGLSPQIVLLEEVAREDLDQAERSWIALLREQGARLVNATAGGDRLDLLPEAEARRLANSEWYRRNKTPEAQLRRSRAAKRRWQTLSPERRAAIIRRASEAAALHPHPPGVFTPERRLQLAEAARSRLLALSPEERAERARRAGLRGGHKHWTTEQRATVAAARRAWWNALTPEQKAAETAKRVPPNRNGRRWSKFAPVAGA